MTDEEKEKQRLQKAQETPLEQKKPEEQSNKTEKAIPAEGQKKQNEQPKETKDEGKTEETPKEKRKKKINKMSLDEINKKIEETKEKMGNLISRYARVLLKRKEELTSTDKKEEV